MAIEINKNNISELSENKIIVLMKNAHLYVLSSITHCYSFMPMMLSMPLRYYDGKSIKESVEQALESNERIIMSISYRDLYEHIQNT